jgi:hypothetical protein
MSYPRLKFCRLGGITEWISIVENGAKFSKGLGGKPLFSALYGMYTVLNELRAVLKLSAYAEQSVTVNKTSVELVAEDDDFREVKKCKRHNSNNASQAAQAVSRSSVTSQRLRTSQSY